MASTIEQAIINDLKTQTSVTTYVNDKIYYLEKDRNAAGEYIIITNPSHTREAIVQTRQKAGHARLQFNCFSRDKWTAKSIAEAVKEVYRNRHGTIQGMDVWDITLGDCKPVAGVSEYRYILDLIIHYSE